jgi:hypothetical protein
MNVQVTSGTGTLYDKEMPDFPVAKISFSLLETEANKYVKKKWWGDFSAVSEPKHAGNYIIGFEDSRKGECVFIPNTEASSKRTRSGFIILTAGAGWAANKAYPADVPSGEMPW